MQPSLSSYSSDSGNPCYPGGSRLTHTNHEGVYLSLPLSVALLSSTASFVSDELFVSTAISAMNLNALIDGLSCSCFQPTSNSLVDVYTCGRDTPSLVADGLAQRPEGFHPTSKLVSNLRSGFVLGCLQALRCGRAPGTGRFLQDALDPWVANAPAATAAFRSASPPAILHVWIRHDQAGQTDAWLFQDGKSNQLRQGPGQVSAKMLTRETS